MARHVLYRNKLQINIPDQQEQDKTAQSLYHDWIRN
jgi:hypothetical protein